MLVSKIQDEAVRHEVEIALRLLPIDAASAVFNVGKALENATRHSVMGLIALGTLVSRSGAVLKARDMSTQFEMINALAENGLLTDRPHLDILRKERNLGGHHLRTREERDELKDTGEIYIRWYLYYISVFEARLAALTSV